MKTKTVKTTPEDEAARLAVIAAMKPWADQLGAQRMLAVLAYTVGQLVAMQDQRRVTPAQAMDVVAENIELGNADFIRHALGLAKGSA